MIAIQLSRVDDGEKKQVYKHTYKRKLKQQWSTIPPISTK
jgi:hypothetical protein